MKDKQLCRSEKKHYRQQRFGVMAGAVQLGALSFYSSSVQVDSFVLRNPPERKSRTVIQFKKNRDLYTCKLKKFTKK
jgi:hypothetical protein